MINTSVNILNTREFRNNFSKNLGFLQSSSSSILVTKNGNPQMCALSVNTLKELLGASDSIRRKFVRKIQHHATYSKDLREYIPNLVKSLSRRKFRKIEGLLSLLNTLDLRSDSYTQDIVALYSIEYLIRRRLSEFKKDITFRTKGTIEPDSYVRVRLEGNEEVFFITSVPLFADPATRIISPDSPVGASLLGSKVGDIITIKTPIFKADYEVLGHY